MNKKSAPKSEEQVPSDAVLRALCDKARLDSIRILRHCEDEIKSPSQALFALILGTSALARGMDMDLHTLIGAIMAAYKEEVDLVVLEKTKDSK